MTPQAPAQLYVRIAVTDGAPPTRCRLCRKPIECPGVCYTCATGLPGQLRPNENKIAGGPEHQIAGSDHTGRPG